MEQLRVLRTVQSGRRPKTKAAGRVCQETDCSTVLSRYNLKETCHRHSPLKFPRVRGTEAAS